MNNDNTEMKLSTAATSYLAGLSNTEKELSQHEINKFVRWYREDKLISKLTPNEVASYAEKVSSANTDYRKKLEVTKAFLSFVKKSGWTEKNLAVNLKAKKVKNVVQTHGKQAAPNVVSLSPEGYDSIKAELDELKQRRLKVIDEIHRAAADKDFKENAPFHAAREQKGYIDGKIMELEETLKTAVVVVVGHNNTLKAGTGDTVTLCDLNSEEEMQFKLVSSREVDASRGMISSASPIGKAVMGHGRGEVIEITVPAGKIRYEIKKLSH
ncbi:MAG: transcription elongation factor GreA [Chloroflexota bacterium]